MVVPDVDSKSDLIFRVRDANDQTLSAGAAEFFSVLLESRSESRKSVSAKNFTTGRALFICGSLAAWEQGIAQRIASKRVPVITMHQRSKLRSARSDHHSVMLAIGNSENTNNVSAAKLLDDLIDNAVVVSELNWSYLFLEGGATASAFIKRKNWSRFSVVPCYLLGVGCLRPTDVQGAPTLFVKPGSYPWPDGVWALLSG